MTDRRAWSPFQVPTFLCFLDNKLNIKLSTTEEKDSLRPSGPSARSQLNNMSDNQSKLLAAAARHINVAAMQLFTVLSCILEACTVLSHGSRKFIVPKNMYNASVYIAPARTEINEY